MDTTALLTILKWLFPSFMGSVLAIYKRATTVGWDESTKSKKRKLIVLGFGAMIMSIFIAYMVGGAILESFAVNSRTFTSMIIYFLLAFSGLKITDAVAKNLDMWVEKLVGIVTSVIDIVAEKVKRWFS